MIFSDENCDPAMPAISFVALITLCFHPAKFRTGKTPVVHCGSDYVPCKVTEIIAKVDVKTKEAIESSPTSINNGDCVLVRFTSTKEFCVEAFHDYQILGRIIVRDFSRVIAIGTIKEVEKKS